MENREIPGSDVGDQNTLENLELLSMRTYLKLQDDLNGRYQCLRVT